MAMTSSDLSHREIADVLQMNEAAVRRNVFEGLRRLRRELAPASASDQPTKEQA
jgi:DNA-directed RNA polymerase specialized sigma24 family protein